MSESESTKQSLNLVPLLKQFAGPEHKEISALQQEITARFSELDEYYHEDVSGMRRVELRALSAFIIKELIDRLIARKGNLPPYGLGTPISNEDSNTIIEDPADLQPLTLEKLSQCENPWYELKNAFRITMQAHLEELFRMPGNERLEKIIDRFKVLDLQERSHRVKSDPYFIRRAISSATANMTRVLEIIPRLIERDGLTEYATPEAQAEIARKSLPLILKLASLNLEQFQEFIEELVPDQKGSQFHVFEADHFYLRGDTGQIPQVDVNQQMFKEYRKYKSWFYSLLRTGCPAAANMNKEGSPLKKLWEYVCDNVAPALYEITAKK